MAAKKATTRRGKAMPIDATAKFEQLLKDADAIQHYQLRLYITGTTLRSAQAVENIRSLCEEYLAGHYDLEVVDIYQQPREATDQQIIAAPTLIKEFPAPPKRLIGNLADRDKVLVGLNLNKKISGEKKSKTTKWLKV